MATTIRDIAQALNISHSTVSRALGPDSEVVKPKTRERILQTARQMNYQPNLAARSLSTGRTGIVALWTNELYQPYFVAAIRQATLQAKHNQVELLIRSMDTHTATGRDTFPLKVDGVLAIDNPEYLDTYLSANPKGSYPPLVNVGSYCLPKLDHVQIDLKSGATQAVLHLLETGRKRIVFLLNSWSEFKGEGRYDGYLETMRHAGLKPELIVVNDTARASSRVCVTNYLKSNPLPEAIFCLCDDMALGAYRALLDCGVKVPDDCALIGFDDIEDVQYLECPLSTVSIPMEEMFVQGFELLKRRQQEPDAPLEHRLLQPQLIIRDSSAPPFGRV